jgi:tRNA pseudouridine38-40 synthase
LDIVHRKARHYDYVDFEISADGFLYNMVRSIVGTLVSVGQGTRPAEWVAEVLKSGDRKVAGQTAPAQGLFLVKVDYDR